MLGTLLAASILVFGFSSEQQYESKLVWLGLSFIVIFVRSCDTFYWYQNLRGKEYNAKLALQRIFAGYIMTAIIWSLYPILFFESLSEIEFASLMAVLLALAGGTTTLLSSFRYASLIFIVTTLLPVCVMALSSGIENRFYLGMMGLIFAGVMSLAGLRAARVTRETMRLKVENIDLIAKMRDEMSQIDEVHDELSEAYSKLNESNSSLEREVERRTERIRQLSNLDPLTGLYNRAAFVQQLKLTAFNSTKRDHSLALLFIDLNGFKNINDTLGHKVGDAVLIEIANRLGDFANDYSAGRWGGDEFLMLLPYAQQESAISVAQAVQSRIAQPLDIMSNQLHLSASIGIAMYPEHTKDEFELIQLADFAMFEQKRLHETDPKMFSQDLYQNLKDLEDLRSGLQQAIAKKQLHLCYQPIMCFETNKPWSYEALLRWNFNGKPIGPDVFIPLAEQSGFIHEIGAWVLNRACIDASQWRHSQDACVSVNVSIIQLLADNFIGTLDKAIKTSGLAAERLHVEITESMFADNKAKVRAQLNAIKARNVQVSIDDFGTGYSSLSQLQTLNFDTIKIDRSFVSNISKGGEAIIRATLFIAKEFGCKTVAEGIENDYEAKVLSEMGVDYLQGFLFAKPMVNDDISGWLDSLEK